MPEKPGIFLFLVRTGNAKFDLLANQNFLFHLQVLTKLLSRHSRLGKVVQPLWFFY